MSKASKLSKSNFQFIPVGVGYYKVIYTSPAGRDRWMCSMSAVSLSPVLYVDKPKLVELDALKWCVRRYGSKLD